MSRNLKKIILISFFCIYLIFIFISSFDKSFKEYHSSFYDNFEHTVLSLPLRIKNSVLPSVKTKEKSQSPEAALPPVLEERRRRDRVLLEPALHDRLLGRRRGHEGVALHLLCPVSVVRGTPCTRARTTWM